MIARSWVLFFLSGPVIFAQEAAAPADSAALPSPRLMAVELSAGDTAVTYSVIFNRLPPRYLVYAMEKSDRVVLDCFETSLEADTGRLPARSPVTEARLSEVSAEDHIRFCRLVLFTKAVVPFETVEGEGRLDIILKWDAVAEKERTAKAWKKRRLIYLSIGAGALAAGVAGYLVTRPEPPEKTVAEDEIPWPAIPTPDGH